MGWSEQSPAIPELPYLPYHQPDKGTGCFHTPSDVLDFRPLILDQLQPIVHFFEEFSRKDFKAGNNTLSGKPSTVLIGPASGT